MKNEKKILIIFLLFHSIFECLTQLEFNVTYEDDYSEIFKKRSLNTKNKNINNNFLKSFAEFHSNYNIDKMRLLLNLCVGNPKQCFNFLLQTNSFHILISDIDSELITCKNKFQWRNSTTLIKRQVETTLRYYNTKVVGWEAIDEFFKGELEEENYSYGKLLFLVISQGGKYTTEEGILGLGYNPSDTEKKYSFIHQLFNKGVIPHKVFSHKLLDDKNGKISIGKIPENIVTDYHHYGRCKALDKIRNGKNYKNNNWECHLDYIIFGNNKMEVKGVDINFLAIRRRSFLPKNIFNIFYENYFKQYINDGKCVIYNDIEEEEVYSYLECDSNVIFEPLTLVFGDWQITFNDKDLFEISIDGLKKKFVFCQKKNYEKFLFGLSILKKMEIVYDYANKEIGFYSENVKYIGKDQNHPPHVKVYDFLDDDEESQAKIAEDEEGDLFPTTETEEKKNDNVTAVKAEKKISLLKILERIFQGGIILSGLIIAGFLVIIGMKFKNRKKLREAKKYLKKKLVEGRV